MDNLERGRVPRRPRVGRLGCGAAARPAVEVSPVVTASAIRSSISSQLRGLLLALRHCFSTSAEGARRAVEQGLELRAVDPLMLVEVGGDAGQSLHLGQERLAGLRVGLIENRR